MCSWVPTHVCCLKELIICQLERFNYTLPNYSGHANTLCLFAETVSKMFIRRACRSFLAGNQPIPCVSTTRKIAASCVSSKKFNYPLTPDDVPRTAGLPTMFRLPSQSTAEGLDACFLGVPLDTGTYAHRTGAR